MARFFFQFLFENCCVFWSCGWKGAVRSWVILNTVLHSGKLRQVSNDQNRGWLGCKGDYTTQPIINQSKDHFGATRIQWNVTLGQGRAGEPTPYKSSTFDDPKPRKQCQNKPISYQFMIFKWNSRTILPWWWSFWVTISDTTGKWLDMGLFSPFSGRQLLCEEGLRQLHVLQPEVLWQNSFREVIGFKHIFFVSNLGWFEQSLKQCVVILNEIYNNVMIYIIVYCACVIHVTIYQPQLM